MPLGSYLQAGTTSASLVGGRSSISESQNGMCTHRSRRKCVTPSNSGHLPALRFLDPRGVLLLAFTFVLASTLRAASSVAASSVRPLCFWFPVRGAHRRCANLSSPSLSGLDVVLGRRLSEALGALYVTRSGGRCHTDERCTDLEPPCQVQARPACPSGLQGIRRHGRSVGTLQDVGPEVCSGGRSVVLGAVAPRASFVLVDLSSHRVRSAAYVRCHPLTSRSGRSGTVRGRRGLPVDLSRTPVCGESMRQQRVSRLLSCLRAFFAAMVAGLQSSGESVSAGGGPVRLAYSVRPCLLVSLESRDFCASSASDGAPLPHGVASGVIGHQQPASFGPVSRVLLILAPQRRALVHGWARPRRVSCHGRVIVRPAPVSVSCSIHRGRDPWSCRLLMSCFLARLCGWASSALLGHFSRISWDAHSTIPGRQVSRLLSLGKLISRSLSGSARYINGRSYLQFQHISPRHSRGVGIGRTLVMERNKSWLSPLSSLHSSLPATSSSLPSSLSRGWGYRSSTSRTIFMRHVFFTHTRVVPSSPSQISATRPSTCGSYVSSSSGGILGA